MRTSILSAALALAAIPAAAVPAGKAEAASIDQLPDPLFAGNRTRETLLVQVLLDRSRHSPGVVDGIPGGNTRRAIEAFERANGLEADGKIDSKLTEKLKSMHGGEVLRSYTITEADAAGPFLSVPSGMEGQAELETLAYETPLEALAEKFHMSQGFLEALNPDADFARAGTTITVIAPGDDELGAQVARVEVDKAASALRAYGPDGKLVATYPATIGSSTFPSPSGSMEVRAIAPEPGYYFDPSNRDWGPDRKLTIAAGPNNPVGSTWIDLTREGYGIHGTPEPKLIGKTSSHGCVRLTNWDAQELAGAVKAGTKVEFVGS